jgi:hypothetical protein
VQGKEYTDMTKDSNLRIFCFACRTLLAEAGEPEPTAPCPKCGNTITASYRPGEEFRIVAGGFSLVSRPPKGGRWDTKSVSKHSHFADTGDDHFIERIIDRPGDHYYERIVDVGTGKIIRDVDEPLTEHKGRGSARKPRNF